MFYRRKHIRTLKILGLIAAMALLYFIVKDCLPFGDLGINLSITEAR